MKMNLKTLVRVTALACAMVAAGAAEARETKIADIEIQLSNRTTVSGELMTDDLIKTRWDGTTGDYAEIRTPFVRLEGKKYFIANDLDTSNAAQRFVCELGGFPHFEEALASGGDYLQEKLPMVVLKNNKFSFNPEARFESRMDDVTCGSSASMSSGDPGGCSEGCWGSGGSQND